MTGKKVKVLLVDDHKEIRKGWVCLFGEMPEVEIAGEASDGLEAVRLAREVQPDVIIMDVFMPEMNGIEATRIIHSELPEVRVLGLSMSDEAERDMMEAGAAGYVSKQASFDVIVETLRECCSAVAKAS